METESFAAGFSTAAICSIDKDTADLDKILLNLEQDTSKQIQQLEKENRQIISLENRVKLTEDKTRDLEQANNKLDEDTKAVHCQFKQNKDSIQGLKKHYTVLVEHQEALSQRYRTLQDDWSEQRIDIDKSLLHYEDIWRRYKAKYESMPMAVELRKHKQDVDKIQSKLQQTSDINTELKQKLCALQDKDGSKSWKKCIVELAKMKIETYKVEQEINQFNEENYHLSLKVKEKKDKQNMLMQEYHAKKKQKEETNQKSNQNELQQIDTTHQHQQIECMQQQRDTTQQQMEHMQQPQVDTTWQQQQQMGHMQQRQKIDTTPQQQQKMEHMQQRQHIDVTQQQQEMEPMQQRQQMDTTQQQQQIECRQQPQVDTNQDKLNNVEQQQKVKAVQQQQVETIRTHHLEQQHESTEIQQMEKTEHQETAMQQPPLSRAFNTRPSSVEVTETRQVESNIIPQSTSSSQIPIISTPVTPLRGSQRHPDSLQEPDKTGQLKIPLLDVSSPIFLGTTTKNIQQRVSSVPAVIPPQHSRHTNLIKYKPRDTGMLLRIPSKSSATHHENIQVNKSQNVPSIRSMYYQVPSIYQPPPSPHLTNVQVSSVGAAVSGTQIQIPTLPTRPYHDNHSDQVGFQRSNVHISTQEESNMMESTVGASSIIDTQEMSSRNSQSHPQLIAENKDETTPKLQKKSLANELPHDSATSQSIADQSPCTDVTNTYEVLLPEDGKSLFETHKASFERNTNSSPGFEFKRRPMFSHMQDFGEQGPDQDKNSGDQAEEGNPFFQSFFQLGIGENTVPSRSVQSDSNYALFGGNENTGSRKKQSPGFMFAFDGEQDTDNPSPGFNFMGADSPDDTTTKEKGFTLF